MNGEVLEYIAAVYECKSFKLAAETLHVSYSNLIKQISRAEYRLGIRIFERGNGRQPITLTNEGRLIINSVLVAVTASRDINNKAQSFVNQQKTIFNLGLSLMRNTIKENKILTDFSLREHAP